MDKPTLSFLERYLTDFDNWKQSFGEWDIDPTLIVDEDRMEEVFSDLIQRFEGNYPFHHPVYAGQMLKPPHPAAWAAYAFAMSVNPNNHALDGGPPSSAMEKEVIAELAKFFGYGKEYLGHLTASGTIANLEALWVARESHPGKGIAFSENAHYTHERMGALLGMTTQKIDVLEDGMLDLESIDVTTIGTLVVTLGTTGLGDVEPLHHILHWSKANNIRIHIDTAYGGFFHTISNSTLIDNSAWNVIHEADSIVIDPHKHGMQPYGCGCVLFKDPNVARFYLHDSPYTYYTSDELHLGEISLECSRAGAAAVAFWATLQLFPLQQNAGFGPIMKQCRFAALHMHNLLVESSKLNPFKEPELDIIAYFPIPDQNKFSEISKNSVRLFEDGMRNKEFYVSLYKVPSEKFRIKYPEYEADEEIVTILRSVLMRPEQSTFVEELVNRMENHL